MVAASQDPTLVVRGHGDSDQGGGHHNRTLTEPLTRTIPRYAEAGLPSWIGPQNWQGRCPLPDPCPFARSPDASPIGGRCGRPCGPRPLSQPRRWILTPPLPFSPAAPPAEAATAASSRYDNRGKWQWGGEWRRGGECQARRRGGVTARWRVASVQ